MIFLVTMTLFSSKLINLWPSITTNVQLQMHLKLEISKKLLKNILIMYIIIECTLYISDWQHGNLADTHYY